VNILSETDFPVHEDVKVIKGVTISKSVKWWSAVLLYELYGKRKIAIYIWQLRNGAWKRKNKLIIGGRYQWENMKQVVEQFLTELEKTKQTP